MTLPTVATSSVSKLSFADSNGKVTIPSTLGTTVVGSNADSGTALIDTSPPELAIARNTGSIWQRNVIVPTPIFGGAEATLYVKAPVDLFTTDNSNQIQLYPFPAFTTDILEVAYTTNSSPVMADSDGYTNFFPYYSGDTASIGWTPPGSWSGDSDFGAGFRNYYFDPIPITGLRIKLGQQNYYSDGANYIYSYGAALIDLRYQKFVSSGQIMLRFDAPDGDVINNVTSVTPQIFNVNPALIPEVFSYTPVYETAFGSGIYTTTPVANSQRVWLQVTLNLTPGGGSPALSGLYISYT
jgi:hypothetical protein